VEAKTELLTSCFLKVLIDQFAQNVYIPTSNRGREEWDISSLGF
jgi:hypothetical protein